MATSIEDCKKYIESVVRQYRITVEPYETVIEDCWRAVWPIIEANSGDINWFAQSDPNFNGIIMNILRDYLEQQEAYDNRDRYAIRKNYPEFIFESYNVDYKAAGEDEGFIVSAVGFGKGVLPFGLRHVEGTSLFGVLPLRLASYCQNSANFSKSFFITGSKNVCIATKSAWNTTIS